MMALWCAVGNAPLPFLGAPRPESSFEALPAMFLFTFPALPTTGCLARLPVAEAAKELEEGEDGEIGAPSLNILPILACTSVNHLRAASSTLSPLYSGFICAILRALRYSSYGFYSKGCRLRPPIEIG